MRERRQALGAGVMEHSMAPLEPFAAQPAGF
jgi:hypothetical protein